MINIKKMITLVTVLTVTMGLFFTGGSQQAQAKRIVLFANHSETYKYLAEKYKGSYDYFIGEVKAASTAPSHKKLERSARAMRAGDIILRDYVSRYRDYYYVYLPGDYKITTVDGVMTHRAMKEKVFKMMKDLMSKKHDACYVHGLEIQKVYWKQTRSYDRDKIFQVAKLSKFIPCSQVVRKDKVVPTMKAWASYIRKKSWTQSNTVGYKQAIDNGDKIYIHADGKRGSTNYRDRIVYYWTMTVYGASKGKNAYNYYEADERLDNFHSFDYMRKHGKVVIQQGKIENEDFNKINQYRAQITE